EDPTGRGHEIRLALHGCERQDVPAWFLRGERIASGTRRTNRATTARHGECGRGDRTGSIRHRTDSPWRTIRFTGRFQTAGFALERRTANARGIGCAQLFYQTSARGDVESGRDNA